MHMNNAIIQHANRRVGNNGTNEPVPNAQEVHKQTKRKQQKKNKQQSNGRNSKQKPSKVCGWVNAKYPKLTRLASSLLDKNKVESEQTVETKQTKVDTRRN